jgi:hypothetical protein
LTICLAELRAKARMLGRFSGRAMLVDTMPIHWAMSLQDASQKSPEEVFARVAFDPADFRAVCRQR